MARCIIHVGMPLTGTKSIQFSLKNLDDEGFYYARIGKQPNHSAAIAVLFAERGDRSPMLKRLQKEGVDPAALANQIRRDLRASLEAADGRTLVLSGEGILQLPPSGLRKLKALLNRMGCDDIEIFAYVRAPISYIESAVQQRIRHGNATHFRIGESLPRYRDTFAKFDEVFGAFKTQLVPFDPGGFPEGDVVRDFCARTGIPLSDIRPVRRNMGITRLAAQLRFQFVAHARAKAQEPMRPAQSIALCDRLRPLDLTPFRLAPAVLQPFVDEISADVVWMEQRLGAVFSEDMDARPGDVSTEADLLAPVPGIDDRLRAILLEDGDDRDTSTLETPALLLRIANRARPARDPDKSVKQDKAASEAQPAGNARSAREKRVAREAPGKRPAKPEPKPLRFAFAAAQEGRARPAARTPLSAAPPPLLNRDKNIMALWSPKSACTTVYVWFSHVSGFSEDVRNYASWPHKHRTEQFMKSPLYAASARDGMAGSKAVRIIRDPYGRAVSIYRHALQTQFADEDMRTFSSGQIRADTGYSFQQFLDLLEQLDMTRVDSHFRPQFHPYETVRRADRVINISKSDLFTELNAFEEEAGLPRTDFADLDWLHTLEHKRKASQEPIAGEGLDDMPFSRRMAREGKFPSYAQLLTPRARRRIESIYKSDFDAYHEFL